MKPFLPLAALLLVASAAPLPLVDGAGGVGLGAAQAQAPNLADHGSGPVQVDADNGIEWHREEKFYVANGNAVATRGDTRVVGDRLIARYREDAHGKTAVYKLEAEGKLVTIASASATVYGERATYDVDRGVLVLTGRNLCMVTTTDTVTARDSLEYWENAKLAVARGNAVATRDVRRAAADTLVAHVAEDNGGGKGGKPAKAKAPPPPLPASNAKPGQPTPPPNNSRIQKVDGHGNVRISSANEIATGAIGTYDLDANIAHVSGNVKVTQGRQQLNGEYADVDFNTGVSRMLSGPAAGRAGERARGLLYPDDNKRDPATPAAVPANAPLPTRKCG